jgi:hypothetical protein
MVTPLDEVNGLARIRHRHNPRGPAIRAFTSV